MKLIESLHWIDPRCRIGRAGFAVAQFILISLAQALLRSINSAELRHVSTQSMVLAPIGSAVVFALMYIFTAKRLLDVGWSWRWALLVSGPTLIYLLLAVWHPTPEIFRALIIPPSLLFLGFCGLVLLLLVLPGKATEVPRGSPITQPQR